MKKLLLSLPLGLALALGHLASGPCLALDPATSQQAPAPAPPDEAQPAAAALVRGTIKAITKPPRPRSVTYKDAVISIDLVDVQVLEGKVEHKEILVFAWGMRDNTWTPAADLRVGQAIQLRLRPWDEVAEKYGSYNRIELEGEEIFALEPYWADSAEPAPR